MGAGQLPVVGGGTGNFVLSPYFLLPLTLLSCYLVRTEAKAPATFDDLALFTNIMYKRCNGRATTSNLHSLLLLWNEISLRLTCSRTI